MGTLRPGSTRLMAAHNIVKTADAAMKSWLYLVYICLLTAGAPEAGASGITPLPGTPASRQLALPPPLQWLQLSRCAIAFYKRTIPTPRPAVATQGEQPWYFANKYVTALTPRNAGVWRNTRKGRVWRLALQSAGAYSLYATLHNLRLAPGVQLFIYNPAYRQVQGPYTAADLPGNNVLAIPPLAGDKIVMELNVPARLKNYGSLTVAAVYHDALNVLDFRGAAYTPTACEENVNCTNGSYWQTEKRAVCKIIADGALCTGTLVANTSRSNTPYVLTAYHVIFTPLHAQEAIFLFNYEHTRCNSTETVTTPAVTGSRLLAAAEGGDAALLLLNAVPPAACKPYYAGWDAGDAAPTTPAATLHHPWGRPKQIALTWQQIPTANYGSAWTAGAFWQCNWDVGVTQPGSSGAPLFNQQHRLVGTLTGGDATCGAGGSDYFFKLARAWKNGNAITNPLQAWLDAAATGSTAMDGYDPYGFDSTACNDAWNIFPHEKTDSTPLQNTRTGLPYPATTPLAEQFLCPGSLLISAVYLRIAALYAADTADYITLTVWEGDAVPGNVVYRQNIPLTQLHTGVVTLTPDSAIALRGNFFIGYMPHIHPQSQLTLYRAASRGKEGPSTLYVQSGGWQAIQQLNSNMATSAGIGIQECYGNTRRPVYGNIRVYPNPCNGYLHFTLPGSPAVQKVVCVNSGGKQVPVNLQPGESSNTLYFQLPAGVYYLQVFTAVRTFTSTFVQAANVQ